MIDMAKESELYHSYFALIRAIAGQENLLKCLVPIGKQYKPLQKDSLISLLENLNNLAQIFMNGLNQLENIETNESSVQVALVKDTSKTFKLVEEAVEDILADIQGDDEISDALTLPLDKSYWMLMNKLRFDYMDITKYHYTNLANSNKTPGAAKMVRLAQELADISTALPAQHTDAVFVRVDRTRVDMMKAMISGAEGTPYAHGLFEYDMFYENDYPNKPPKMNLTTTGNGQIRFNPNLYACGKVCLSLLGTWRGHASENWDPKISTSL